VVSLSKIQSVFFFLSNPPVVVPLVSFPVPEEFGRSKLQESRSQLPRSPVKSAPPSIC